MWNCCRFNRAQDIESWHQVSQNLLYPSEEDFEIFVLIQAPTLTEDPDGDGHAGDGVIVYGIQLCKAASEQRLNINDR